MASLLVIFFQDMRDRAVYWFLFPLVGILFACLHYEEVGQLNFLVNTGFNFLFTGIILLLLLLYIYFKTTKFSFNGALGFGDLLMFAALIFTFAPFSYATLIVFGLIASLACHLILSRFFKFTLSRKRDTKHPENSVPLAGYLAIYFLIIYASNWSGLTNTLYLI